MKQLLALLFILSSFANLAAGEKKEILHDFVVIICSYNNRKYVERNLISIFNQNYPQDHFRVIYVDDCSQDGTGEFVEEFKQKHSLGDRLMIIHNDQRMLKACNLYKAGHLCQKHEIIVEVDGDDWLAKSSVLPYLNAVYQNKNIWLTYGNNKKWPTGRVEKAVQAIPSSVVRNGSFRKYTTANFWTALRTYYAWLFQRIQLRDFMYPAQKNRAQYWFDMSIDVSIFLAMLEMARERHLFIREPLYVHNIETNFNDHKINVRKQHGLEMLMRRLKPYNRLSDSQAYHVQYYA